MHAVRELCYTKGVRGEGLENVNMASFHLHQPPLPLNYDWFLIISTVLDFNF